ncbi:MAG TPA: hypothetical protein PKK10_11820 [Woeseiaceae bacterium]|nr:hypothetical protein [Woeseiaceae bacterium]
MMRFVVMVIALLLTLPASIPVVAAGPSDGCKLRLQAQAAIAGFREQAPHTVPYFQEAYAFAVFPSVTRVGLGFGGAYGKGIVMEGNEVIGVSKLWQFTSGIQAGARNVSTIVFFKDQQALQYFQAEKSQFLGQAAIALATVGLNGTPAYNDGVAIFTRTRLGLMLELTVSAAKFTYRDIGQEPACVGASEDLDDAP